ncbi:trypsin-like peptidase domain-containing protein [soil metagenome]
MSLLPGRRLALLTALFASQAAQAETPLVARVPTPTLTANRRDALVDIVEKVKGAVVNIHSERTVNPAADDPFKTATHPFQMQRVNGMGTGIVLDPRGYVITNYHVVDDIQVLKVRLVDGKQLSARVLALDKKADLALIKIDVTSPLTIVPLGTATDLFEAEQVIAIGNAFGYEHTVSIGNVAYKSRDVSLNKEINYQGLIQTTAPINPGNSGGPLFNKKGELVGVNVAIRAGAQNIAFAIPVDTMIDRGAEMMSIKKRQGTRHGLVVKDLVERPGEESTVRRWVKVESIESESPATKAGLLAGDVIETIGEVAVYSSVDVERGFLEKAAGTTVAVTAKRNGEPVKVNLTVQAMEKSLASTTDVIARRMGLKVAPVGKEIVGRVDQQLRGGLNVTDTVAGSPAVKAGLQRGDVVIGFHQWEAVNVDNVLFVLNHKDLGTFSPVKTFFIRDGKVRETMLTPAE